MARLELHFLDFTTACPCAGWSCACSALHDIILDLQAQAQLSAVCSERETLLATRMELQSLLERAQMEASRAMRQQQAAEVRNWAHTRLQVQKCRALLCWQKRRQQAPKVRGWGVH